MLAGQTVGSQVVFSPFASSPAALVLPTGHVAHSRPATRWLIPQQRGGQVPHLNGNSVSTSCLSLGGGHRSRGADEQRRWRRWQVKL